MPDKLLPPKIENAPGLVIRRIKNGWVFWWFARTDIVKKGYPIKSQRVFAINGEPDERDRAFISDRCIKLQDEMLVWSRGGIPNVNAFEGTWASLARCFETDPQSHYRKQRYRSRQSSSYLNKVIIRDHGDELIADFRGRDANRWYDEWKVRGVTMAHALIGQMRSLLRFGKTILDDPACIAAKSILSDMRFEDGKPRTSALTRAQVEAIIATAHQRGLHSLALAQAIQFECTLRQKDVIGEWVPQSEPGISETLNGGDKWLRGLRWDEIDQNLVLRHVTSKKQKEIEIDLHNAPLVLAELARYATVPKGGPIVVHEGTQLPYKAMTFRYLWRKVATKAGIPKTVKNMDTRAGAITEALQAGARIEAVRKAATHSDQGMTARYSRNDSAEIADVMKLRAERANKTGTERP
jgi:hypothetical protein